MRVQMKEERGLDATGLNDGTRVAESTDDVVRESKPGGTPKWGDRIGETSEQ